MFTGEHEIFPQKRSGHPSPSAPVPSNPTPPHPPPCTAAADCPYSTTANAQPRISHRETNRQPPAPTSMPAPTSPLQQEEAHSGIAYLPSHPAALPPSSRVSRSLISTDCAAFCPERPLRPSRTSAPPPLPPRIRPYPSPSEVHSHSLAVRCVWRVTGSAVGRSGCGAGSGGVGLGKVALRVPEFPGRSWWAGG